MWHTEDASLSCTSGFLQGRDEEVPCTPPELPVLLTGTSSYPGMFSISPSLFPKGCLCSRHLVDQQEKRLVRRRKFSKLCRQIQFNFNFNFNSNSISSLSTEFTLSPEFSPNPSKGVQRGGGDTYSSGSGRSRRRRWWPSAPGTPRRPPRPLR